MVIKPYCSAILMWCFGRCLFNEPPFRMILSFTCGTCHVVLKFSPNAKNILLLNKAHRWWLVKSECSHKNYILFCFLSSSRLKRFDVMNSEVHWDFFAVKNRSLLKCGESLDCEINPNINFEWYWKDPKTNKRFYTNVTVLREIFSLFNITIDLDFSWSNQR